MASQCVQWFLTVLLRFSVVSHSFLVITQCYPVFPNIPQCHRIRTLIFIPIHILIPNRFHTDSDIDFIPIPIPISYRFRYRFHTDFVPIPIPIPISYRFQYRYRFDTDSDTDLIPISIPIPIPIPRYLDPKIPIPNSKSHTVASLQCISVSY